jgi:hypothetical protein
VKSRLTIDSANKMLNQIQPTTNQPANTLIPLSGIGLEMGPYLTCRRDSDLEVGVAPD